MSDSTKPGRDSGSDSAGPGGVDRQPDSTKPRRDRQPDSAGPGGVDRQPDSTEPGRLDSRPVHKGRIVDLSIDTVRFPDGSTGELELIRHSGAAAVLPVLGDRSGPDPLVLLIRQYRYAAGGYMLEVPAGRPDAPGEDWELCARRELEEETGLVAGTIEFMTTIHTTPGFTDERIRLFLATDCTTGSEKKDDDEFIEPVTMPISEALEKVRSGEITDGKTICTLLYAAGFMFGG